MRESTYKYDNCPVYYLPETIQLIPEEFRDITDKVAPGVVDYYMISNYGRIWHKFENRFLTNNIDSKGYLYKPLVTKDGIRNFRVHRLVLMTFNYIEGCENAIVNHIDGNKQNPCIWNLEWSTYSDNAYHAINAGLKADQIPDEKIHEICKLLEAPSNIPISEIAKRVGVSYTTVSAIQCRRTHTDISDQYNFGLRKIPANFDNEQIRSLCQYYQDNPKPKDIVLDVYCTNAICESLGIENPSTRLIRSAKKIKQKETYWYISKDYNF